MISTVTTLSLPLAGSRACSVLLAAVAGLACAVAVGRTLPITIDAIAAAVAPFCIEGSIRHPADGDPWEYTVVVSIRNDRGQEIARKLVGVGAMNPNEQRTFTLSIEAVTSRVKSLTKDGTRH